MKLQPIYRWITLTVLLHVSLGIRIKVAVYEHVVISPDNPERNFSRQAAFRWMSKNLAVFEKQIRLAANQGAKMIVFPEYGVTGFDHTRDSIVPFLEDIPDGIERWNPCEHPETHPDTLVLRNLSCIARSNSIYIVANMGDIKKCDKKMDKFCPPDGRYQFNTNIVFDDSGTLIARYHKSNMYDETPLFDPSPEHEYIYFDTPYGRFGTIVCFDIIHYYPTQVLINKFGIRNLLVTSAWNVFSPFVISTQMFAGLAKRNNLNVVASNVRSAEYRMAGSGIFGQGVAVSTNLNFNSPDGMLIFADIETDVPKITKPDTLDAVTRSIYTAVSANNTLFGTYDYGMNMSYKVLSDMEGEKSVCQNEVCCTVNYKFKYRDQNEIFILSAADFALEKPGIIHMQFCAVHKCMTNDSSSCGRYITSVVSTFNELKIQGYFDHGVVYPFVSTLDRNQSLHMEMDHYVFDRSNAILQSKGFEHPLYAAVVFSSLYDEERTYAVVGSSKRNVPISIFCLLLLALFCRFYF